MNQRFLGDESIDPAIGGLQSIQAWYRAADIAWQLNDLDETEAALRHVITLCQTMPRNRQTADVLAKHVSAVIKLSALAAQRKDWEATHRYLEEGLQLLDQPTPVAAQQRNLARRTSAQLGVDAEIQGNLELAGQYFRQAIELVRQIPPASDEPDDLVLIRVKVHNSYAIHCKQNGILAEAAEHFRATQTGLDILRKTSPIRPSSRP